MTKKCCNRGETFHSMYTLYWLRKVFRDYVHRNTYKHWNGWCFRKNNLYCFEKGYDEDYAKYHMKEGE